MIGGPFRIAPGRSQSRGTRCLGTFGVSPPAPLLPPDGASVCQVRGRSLEGGGPGGQVLNPDDAPALERGDLVVELVIELDPAALAARVVAEPNRDAVAGVDDLLRDQPQLVEGLVEPVEEAPDVVVPLPGVRRLVLRQHPLDLRIAVFEGQVEVTPVVGVDEVLRHLHVVLRHRQPG